MLNTIDCKSLPRIWTSELGGMPELTAHFVTSLQNIGSPKSLSLVSARKLHSLSNLHEQRRVRLLKLAAQVTLA